MPFYGSVLTNTDSPALAAISGQINRRHRTYGFSEGADVRAQNLVVKARSSSFELWCDGKKLGRIEVMLPGRHNAENALAASAVALELEIGFDAIHDGLKSFTGVGRRFEVLGEQAGVTVVDDYGHHPTEVRAAIAAGRAWIEGKGRLIAIFQPHLYSRTQDFYREFAEALSHADSVILAPVYPARERPMPGVESHLIADAMPSGKPKGGCQVVELASIPEAVCAIAKPGDLVMTIGAGSIYHSGPQILARLSAVEVAQ